MNFYSYISGILRTHNPLGFSSLTHDKCMQMAFHEFVFSAFFHIHLLWYLRCLCQCSVFFTELMSFVITCSVASADICRKLKLKSVACSCNISSNNISYIFLKKKTSIISIPLWHKLATAYSLLVLSLLSGKNTIIRSKHKNCSKL